MVIMVQMMSWKKIQYVKNSSQDNRLCSWRWMEKYIIFAVKNAAMHIEKTKEIPNEVFY